MGEKLYIVHVFKIVQYPSKFIYTTKSNEYKIPKTKKEKEIISDNTKTRHILFTYTINNELEKNLENLIIEIMTKTSNIVKI